MAKTGGLTLPKGRPVRLAIAAIAFHPLNVSRHSEADIVELMTSMGPVGLHTQTALRFGTGWRHTNARVGTARERG